jgi:hypothetical protein
VPPLATEPVISIGKEIVSLEKFIRGRLSENEYRMPKECILPVGSFCVERLVESLKIKRVIIKKIERSDSSLLLGHGSTVQGSEVPG